MLRAGHLDVGDWERVRVRRARRGSQVCHVFFSIRCFGQSSVALGVLDTKKVEGMSSVLIRDVSHSSVRRSEGGGREKYLNK